MVILICLFNLRYYILEGNLNAAERRSWRGWFSLRDRDNLKGSKVIRAIEIDGEKGQIIRNPPLTALHPRSTIRRTLLAMTPDIPSLPSPLPLYLPPPTPTPSIHPTVAAPPSVIIKPRSRKNSEASDLTHLTSIRPMYKLPSPLPSHESLYPSSSFEASTGIGMGPTYRPPSPPSSSAISSHIQPNAKPAEIRNSIVMEFQHYFNPFAWMAMGAQEGKDLDGQDIGGPAASSASQQRGTNEHVSHHGEVSTAV